MDKETLNRACLEKAIVDHLKDAHQESRDILRDELDAGDRIKSDFGMAYVTDPKPAFKVTDPDAFLEWVEANCPDALVTTVAVSPAFKDAILKAGGVTLDGQVIPVDGVELTQGSPTLTVKPSEKAKILAPIYIAGALEAPGREGFPDELEAS